MLFFLTGQMTKCPAKVLSFLRPLLHSRQWSNSFSFTGNLHLLLTQITKYQGSCKFSGANIWNTLPLALRSQHDLNKFGFDLKRHFMHQSIPPVPSPHPPPPICPPCQSRGWGICKFCTARGPGICQPRGHSRAFDTHMVSYQNITTQMVLLEKKADWLICQGQE